MMIFCALILHLLCLQLLQFHKQVLIRYQYEVEGRLCSILQAEPPIANKRIKIPNVFNM